MSYRFRELHKHYLPAECEFTIAGMAHPYRGVDSYDSTSETTIEKNLQYLCDAGYGALISLDMTDIDRVESAAKRFGLQHFHCPIGDWDRPTVEQFDAVFELVASIKCPTAIHCKAGNGRTGTQLAALVLRQLVQAMVTDRDFNTATLHKSLLLNSFIAPSRMNSTDSDSSSSSSSSSDSDSSSDNDFSISFFNTRSVRCTSLVQQAIQLVRQLQSPEKDNTSVNSVETTIEIRALCEYQEVLITRMTALATPAPKCLKK
ncbi:MAG: hypothetical protein P1U63_04005 [Coxiellaceae bacterium]|nr:hypothetical protein [Coxiellaceae bacterium]